MGALERPDIGATLRGPEACRFRVWAPFVPQVTLCLLRDERRIPLDPEPRGYHSALVEDVRAGDRYLFDIGNDRRRPDPASRSQPDGVHGPSAVVDTRFAWSDDRWSSPELAEWVIYELHVGTFSNEGTFEAAIGQLDRLRDLGVTAVELMPVAQFSGARNWGYDGAYPFAVHASYGGAAGLQRFVDAVPRSRPCRGSRRGLQPSWPGGKLPPRLRSVLHGRVPNALGRRPQLRRAGQRPGASVLSCQCAHVADRFSYRCAQARCRSRHQRCVRISVSRRAGGRHAVSEPASWAGDFT